MINYRDNYKSVKDEVLLMTVPYLYRFWYR